MARFEVVSMMRETGDIVARFITYYRKAGAARITLFYDAEHLPEDVEACTAPSVRIIACDDAFWRARDGGRPELVEERQIAVFREAFAALESEWLLACDADEFVTGDISLSAALSRMPASVEVVTIPPVEAVWAPEEDIDTAFGSTWFRVPEPAGGRLSRMSSALAALRRHGWAGALFRRGLLSHVQGKFAIRRGTRYDDWRLHRVAREGQMLNWNLQDVRPGMPPLWLAHFDAICFARWVEKFRRPAMMTDRALLSRRSTRRRAQIALFRRALRKGEPALRRLFTRLYVLRASDLRRGTVQGRLIRRDIFGTQPKEARA